ncbi:hypothetical protein T484DRAFT_1837575 [Baffinella frigidus]|nr:hypothetical protein T484DRAFT_1837575 [Cryptophyta sp. CCMP2293]
MSSSDGPPAPPMNDPNRSSSQERSMMSSPGGPPAPPMYGSQGGPGSAPPNYGSQGGVGSAPPMFGSQGGSAAPMYGSREGGSMQQCAPPAPPLNGVWAVRVGE